MPDRRSLVSAEDSFERTLAALHRAALDDTHWLSAAALLNDACGATGHALVFAQGSSVHDVQFFLMRYCSGGQRRDDLVHTYLRDYVNRDERIPHVARLTVSRACKLGFQRKQPASLANSIQQEAPGTRPCTVHRSVSAGPARALAGGLRCARGLPHRSTVFRPLQAGRRRRCSRRSRCRSARCGRGRRRRTSCRSASRRAGWGFRCRSAG